MSFHESIIVDCEQVVGVLGRSVEQMVSSLVTLKKDRRQ